MKTIYLGMVALMLFASLSLVIAEESITNESLVPTLYSEDNLSQYSDNLSNEIEEIDQEFNESVSSWDVNQEKMKNWFTFNQEKKTMRELKIAQMLLVQARIEARNNNTGAMEEALEAHNRILLRIEDRVRSINEDGNATTAAQKVVGLERAIQVHELRISRLASLLESENLTEEQRTKIELKIERAENSTAHLSEVQNEKLEKLKIRLIAVGNLTEEQADAIISELQNVSGVTEMKFVLRDARKEYRQEFKQEFKDGKLKIKEKIKEKRLNANGTGYTEFEVETELEVESEEESASSVNQSEDEIEEESEEESEDDKSNEESSGSPVNSSSNN